MKKFYLENIIIASIIVLSICSLVFADNNTLNEIEDINMLFTNEVENYVLNDNLQEPKKLLENDQKSIPDKVLKDGKYRIAMYSNQNIGLDINAGLQENGANVLIWDWYEENNLQKQFNIEYDETDGYYTIENDNSGKLLTVQDDETNVIQYEAYETDAQKWKITKNSNGSYSIISKLNNLYLDIQNGNISNGANVQVYEGNGTVAQQFSFIEIIKPERTIEDGTYRIAMFSNSNIGVDVDAGSKENGANVLLWEWYQENNLQKQFNINYDEEDGYYTITNVNSGKLLTVQDSGTTNSTNVWQYEANGTNSQKWKIVKNSNGSYSIISKIKNLYLDIQNGNISNGANVQIYESNGSNAQQFKIIEIIEPEKTIEEGTYRIAMFNNPNIGVDIDAGSKNNGANVLLWDWYEENNTQKKFNFRYDATDGYYTITNVNSGKVLDVQNGGMSNGTNVWQYEENGTNSQKWQIIKNKNGSYSLVSKLNGLYLDIQNGNIAAGGNVQIYEDNDSTAQQFSLIKLDDQIEKPVETGFFEIASVIDRNKIFDVTDGSTEENVPVQLWDLDGLVQQKFKITYNNTYYTITSVHSNKVLAINDENKLIQKTENGDVTEKWQIKLYGNDKYTFISLANNYCIDIPSANASNGAKLQVYESNNSDAQRFYLTDRNPMQGTQSIEDGTYRIISPIDNMKAFDVTDGLSTDGTEIQLWDNDGFTQQKFEIIYVGDGYYKIKSQLSGKVLTVESEIPNLYSTITQEQDNNLDTQKWIINDLGNGLYNIISKCENLYITNNAVPQNGEKLTIQRNNYPSSQSFILINETPKNNISIIQDGIYQIKMKNNINSFDINGASYDNYANLQIWTCDNSPQKKFRIERIGDTNYYKIVATHSAKALDVQNGGINIGTNIDQYDQNGTDNQFWYFKDCGNGYYSIISKANGLYLDIAGGAIGNCGANVQLYYSNNSDAQQFKLEHVNIVESGTYEIETKLNSNMVVDVSGGSYDNGANVQLWTADNVNQQKFILEPQSDDVYIIKAKHSNKVLTVDTNTNNVYQADCSWADNQKWKIQEAGYGYYKLISQYNSCALDINIGYAINGQNVQVYADNGSDAQKFRFVTGYRKFYEQGTYGTSGKRQSGQGGYDLTYYKIGKGSKHLFTTFSIHGFEDSYWKDGSELTYMANQLKDYLYNNLSEDLINEWTIYIFPNLNPDGQYDGWTNDGPGRTTVYSNAPNHQGIDMNRACSIGFQRITSARNYTGTAAFQAPEAAQLRDFILGHQGSSNVLIDVHGWLNETIGDNGVGSYYRSEFGISKHIGSYGNGYLINWARSLPNTRSMLLELPGVSNHSQVVNWDYAGKFNRATMRLLNDF